MAPTWSAEHREGQEALPEPATLGAPTRRNATPAEPIEGQLAFKIPRFATLSFLVVDWFHAYLNRGLQGSDALLFAFLGRNANSRSQATYLVSNMISPVLIWTIEANRGNTSPAEGVLQMLTGVVVQFSGIARVAPIYYIYSIATWDSARSDEDSDMSPEAAKAVLPVTLLGYVLPAALLSLLPLTASGISGSHFNIQSSVVHAFRSAPMIVAGSMACISVRTKGVPRKTLTGLGEQKENAMPKDTKSSQGHNSIDTLHSLRLAYAVTFAIQAAQHLYTIARKTIRTGSVAAAVGSLLTHRAIPGRKISSLALYSAATLGFGLFTVWELRRRGMVSDRDAKRGAVGVLAGQVLFGPGATYAGLWWWREGVLARMRERA